MTQGIDPTASAPLTAADLCERYLRENLLRPASLVVYRGIAKRFDQFSGNRNIRTVDLELVIAWRDDVLKRASPRTWNTYLQHLRTLWNWGVRRRHVESSPFGEIRRAPIVGKPKKTLATGILPAVLDFLRNDTQAPDPGWFWSVVLRTFYFTGIRKRQLLELHWGDVDFTYGTLRLRSEGSKTRREWTIPLVPEAVHDLEYLRERTMGVYADRGHVIELAHDAPLFNLPLFNPAFGGDRLSAYALEGFCRKMKSRFGYSISPHRFRHGLATSLANEAGTNLKALQQLLGHTSMHTTLEYVHPDLGQMRALAERLPVPDTKAYDRDTIVAPRPGRETRGR